MSGQAADKDGKETVNEAGEEELARARELLDAYHDRELNDEEKRFVEEALGKYSQLAEESSVIVGMKNVLADFEWVEPAPGFSEKLMQRLEVEKAVRKKRMRTAVIIATVLIAVAALLAAFVLY